MSACEWIDHRIIRGPLAAPRPLPPSSPGLLPRAHPGDSAPPRPSALSASARVPRS
jgi:hypothetical protein